MFIPEINLLGTHREEENFSYSVIYESTDDVTGITTTLPVQLVAIDVLPPTINIDSNTIHGRFSDSFEQSITYLSNNKNYITVAKFREVSNIDETIAFHPSSLRSRTFNIQATAGDNIDTTIYQIIVMNDWTNGRNALVALVEETR